MENKDEILKILTPEVEKLVLENINALKAQYIFLNLMYEHNKIKMQDDIEDKDNQIKLVKMQIELNEIKNSFESVDKLMEEIQTWKTNKQD